MTLAPRMTSKSAESGVHIAAMFGSLNREGELLSLGLAHQSQWAT